MKVNKQLKNKWQDLKEEVLNLTDALKGAKPVVIGEQVLDLNRDEQENELTKAL